MMPSSFIPSVPGAFQTAEGIILRAASFRDYDQILTLFTRQFGIIKLLYKGSRSKRRGVQGLCNPLNCVEVAYREKRGEIFSCHEMTCIDLHSPLRKELLFLETACDLLHVILATQSTGRPAPQLYALLRLYLKNIPKTANPWVLAASFRLKVLRHDGFLTLPFNCSECRQFLESDAYTLGAEAWCAVHRPSGGWHWDTLELLALYQLAICQSLREITSTQLPDELRIKISAFFEQAH